MMYSGPVDESMPSTSGIAKESSQERDRRSHPRGSCELFDYTDFGPVILFNLSEGGLGFHGVAAFVEGQVVHLRFVLPGTSKHIEADAQVTRSDDSTKRGGLRFVDLSEEARQRVRTWICGETKVTGLSSTVQTEVHWHPSSAAIDKPESSAADSAARERARILVDAGIAEAPEPKPDEAQPMDSYAPACGRRGEELSETKEKLPTRQQIERRAYEIYANRGGQSGNEMADWLAAEKELTSRYQREAAEHSSLELQQDSRATRMLLDFYGLREQPFGMTPDPAYLYASRTHGEALAPLSFGIQDNRGFLALIAEPGMGKTTLLYQLLEELRDSARTVFLFQTQSDSLVLYQYILNDLNIDARGMGLVEMHNKLNEVLFETMFARKRFVLVVDEAQNLDDSVLETVRMLSNCETNHTKLLQIVLAGQPRLAPT